MDFEKLKDLETNNYNVLTKKNYDNMYFAFMFEKLPDGVSNINIYIGGINVYKSDDWMRFKKWEDIFYNNFKNIRVTNAKVESIKNQKANSSYFTPTKSNSSNQTNFNSLTID